MTLLQIDCQTRPAGGSSPTSTSGTSGASTRGGGGSSYTYTPSNNYSPVDTSNFVKVDGVPGDYNPLVVPFVEVIRDIVRALTGQVTRSRTCPPSKPCRTRGRRCCGLARVRRGMVCPVRC